MPRPCLKHLLAGLLAGLVLSGCGGTPQPALDVPPAPTDRPEDVVWSLEKNGLRYRIEAAPDLNLEDGIPLGLTICVYQLKDISAFMAQASSAVGIDTLLDGKLEPVEARSSRVYRLQPGSAVDVTTDRMAEARFLAVVAGYAHLRPELCSVVIPFPVHTASEGILFRDKRYSAAPMQALIRLGAESVTITGVERVR